jgi:hypothetical protein
MAGQYHPCNFLPSSGGLRDPNVDSDGYDGTLSYIGVVDYERLRGSGSNNCFREQRRGLRDL